MPFNLLPNPITLYQLFVWVGSYLRQKYRRKTPRDGEPEAKAKYNCVRCCFFEEHDTEEEEEQNELTYQTLMSMLIQRYFTARSEVRNEPPVTASMVSITNQLKDMRAEVKQLKDRMVRDKSRAASGKPRSRKKQD